MCDLNLLKLLNHVAICRNDLPGQSISSATQDLLHLAEGKSPTLVDFAANDLDLVEEKQRLAFLQEALSHYQCTKQYDFMEQVFYFVDVETCYL